jgi:hypothetical protein
MVKRLARLGTGHGSLQPIEHQTHFRHGFAIGLVLGMVSRRHGHAPGEFVGGWGADSDEAARV